MPSPTSPKAGYRADPASTSSSPYIPQDEDDRAEQEHQQEVDLHLATTMSRGLDAGRSRSRSGGKENRPRGNQDNDEDDEDGPEERTDDGSRTSDRYGHLRDAQAEQDAHFFEASASPQTRLMHKPRREQNPDSPSHAAARFYRQNRRRTLSDTSIDSSPGFIDHRHSQASMSLSVSARQPNKLGSTPRQAGGRSRETTGRSARSSRLRAEVQADGHRTRSGEESSGDDDDMQHQYHGSPTSPSGRPRKGTYVSGLSASRPNSPQVNSIDHAMASRRRPSYDIPQSSMPDYSSARLEGSAIANEQEDDEPGVVDHRHLPSSGSRRSPVPHEFLHRSNTQMSDRTHRTKSDGGRERGTDDPTFTPSLSRRPSDIHKVEEDVCYPMLDIREADIHVRERQQSPSRDDDRDPRRRYSTRDMGIPGVLPNFPFPFDFDALQEHCDKEKEKYGLPIPKSRKGVSINDGSAIAGSATTARGISFSPDKPEGMMRRRTNGEVPSRRQRKLSESVGTGGISGHVGRYQRKLAIFEGGATGGMRNDDKASPADVKTPLLNEQSKSRPGFGATAMGTHRSIASVNEKARPYRFSFYSNALPSTIHARSLAEIPGEGQTFEELFVGRQESPPPEEWEGSTAVPADLQGGVGMDSMLPGQRPGVSGTSTPNPQNQSQGPGNGHAPPSLASYKQMGMMGPGMGGMTRLAAGLDEKQRKNIIRSVEDAEANTWWLDVLCPTDAEMKVLGKVFGIHPLTMEDILMEETREKIELFRNYYLVCFRSFDQDPYSPTYLEPLNMYIIVFREGTLSFHFRGTPHPQNVRRRIKQLKDFINVTSDWISYALIDDITDAFGPLIQNIEYEVDSIDELVLILKDAEQSDMLRRIGTCRKKVMGLLRLMGNKADVVKGLAKRCNENWSVAPKSDIGLYLSDIQDHLITMTQNLNHYEKILSRSHSNYLAQISIEMTDANNQINDVLSKLTALGTVLIPMNLVTGLWGMNVRVPGEGIENLHWFFGIVACLLAFALAGGYMTYRAFK